MKPIDEEPWSWRLFEDNDDLYLDVLCSHSAIDYQFVICLNEKEASDFRDTGRSALDRLAHAVHYSAPGVIGNTSAYRGRKVSEAVAKRVREATVKGKTGQEDAT